MALIAALFAAPAYAVFSYWEEPDPSPYIADIGPLPACDYIIDTTAKWANINSTAYRVFCVAPGDYTLLGRINITTDGTSTAKKWLRYYNPSVSDTKHPYDMTDAERAKISQILLNGADYWIIDRLYLQQNTTSSENFVLELLRSDNNILNRIFINYPRENGFLLYNGSDYNVVQHCVVANGRHGSDGAAYFLHAAYREGQPVVAPVTFNRFVGNESINTTDGFQTMGWPPSDPLYVGEEDYRGTVVYNNDFYLTTAKYQNCDGGFTPTGDCACAEEGISFKSGSESATDPVLIAHNRVWGWKVTAIDDPTCVGPSNSGDRVAPMFAQSTANNLRIEGNIIELGGANFTDSIPGSTYRNNLHYDSPNPITVDPMNQYGLRILGTGSKLFTDVAVSGNVFVSINDIANTTTINFSGNILETASASFTNNVLINSNASVGDTFAGTVSGNEYYNTAKPAFDANPAVNVGSVVGTVWDNQFCTTRKRLTAPEQWCFDTALHDDQVVTPSGPSVPTQFEISD